MIGLKLSWKISQLYIEFKIDVLTIVNSISILLKGIAILTVTRKRVPILFLWDENLKHEAEQWSLHNYVLD